jgi:hypothetical protein
MKSFIRKIFEGEADNDCHKYFVRFGKGKYERRFLISLAKSKKIKIRGSFELANDLVKFVNENADLKFSGKVLSNDKIPGKEGKKKGGSFAYEISESPIEEFKNVYFYLLNASSEDIVLKIKKSLPKPGKNVDKIDDKFCSLDLDLKYWDKVKETFFWDFPDNVKKAKVGHTLEIDGIVLPEGVDDPVKMRDLAKRKGKIIRKMDIDGKEQTSEKELVV